MSILEPRNLSLWQWGPRLLIKCTKTQFSHFLLLFQNIETEKALSLSFGSSSSTPSPPFFHLIHLYTNTHMQAMIWGYNLSRSKVRTATLLNSFLIMIFPHFQHQLLRFLQIPSCMCVLLLNQGRIGSLELKIHGCLSTSSSRSILWSISKLR
jgi:hypothetical protein